MKNLLLLFVLLSQQIFAAETYVVGRLYEVTSISEGLLIRLENDAIPTTCPKQSAWMLIPQSSKVIVAVTLSHWLQKKRNVDVYVEPYSGSGYCRVIQVHPR